MSVERPFDIGANEVIYRDESGRPWLVSAGFAKVNGRMEVVSMSVSGVAPSPEELRRQGHLTPNATAEGYHQHLPYRSEAGVPALDSTTWRACGALMRTIRANWLEALTSSGLIDTPGYEAARTAWQTPRERQQGQLELIAATYRDEVAAAERERRRARPRRAVAERLFIGEDAAAQAIARARRAGLLPKTSRGRTVAE